MAKCSILPVGQVDDILVLVGVLGCTIDAFPTNYLGLPFCARFKEKSIWEPIIDKFENRLLGWKFKYLSEGGEINSHQSVLSSVLTYFLSFPYLFMWLTS